MISDISKLMEQYQAWLKDRTALRAVGNAVEITTPFLDRHNDYIQVYVRKSEDGYVITDDGETIEDLEMSGVFLNTPKRLELLNLTAAGFGVKVDDKVISVKTSPERFPLAKHNLVQTIIAVNDLFFTARPIVASLFLEDVRSWLDEADVRFIPDASFIGKTGYTHKFHFAIPKSKLGPERFVQAINNPNKDAAENIVFAWMDTKETRPADSSAFAIINDKERSVPSGMEDALSSYGIVPVRWSNRGQSIERLAA